MLTFPIVSSHNSIEKFERVNNIGVNIFGYKNGSKKEGIRQGVYPRITKTRSSRVVDLLIISDDEKQHYCVIKSMSRLLSSHTTKHQHKRWFCKYCLNGFAKEDSLNDHKNDIRELKQVMFLTTRTPTGSELSHYSH